jgi:hypothetical protein
LLDRWVGRLDGRRRSMLNVWMTHWKWSGSRGRSMLAHWKWGGSRRRSMLHWRRRLMAYLLWRMRSLLRSGIAIRWSRRRTVLLYRWWLMWDWGSKINWWIASWLLLMSHRLSLSTVILLDKS